MVEEGKRQAMSASSDDRKTKETASAYASFCALQLGVEEGRRHSWMCVRVYLRQEDIERGDAVENMFSNAIPRD